MLDNCLYENVERYPFRCWNIAEFISIDYAVEGYYCSCG